MFRIFSIFFSTVINIFKGEKVFEKPKTSARSWRLRRFRKTAEPQRLLIEKPTFKFLEGVTLKLKFSVYIGLDFFRS